MQTHKGGLGAKIFESFAHSAYLTMGTEGSLRHLMESRINVHYSSGSHAWQWVTGGMKLECTSASAPPSLLVAGKEGMCIFRASEMPHFGHTALETKIWYPTPNDHVHQ